LEVTEGVDSTIILLLIIMHSGEVGVSHQWDAVVHLFVAAVSHRYHEDK
jgi:hypothetical protein